MTEKRFTYDFVSVDCPLFYDEGGVIDYDDVVDLLNELYEENEQLKQRIKVLKDTIDGLTGTIAHFDLDEVMWND